MDFLISEEFKYHRTDLGKVGNRVGLISQFPLLHFQSPKSENVEGKPIGRHVYYKPEHLHWLQDRELRPTGGWTEGICADGDVFWSGPPS